MKYGKQVLLMTAIFMGILLAQTKTENGLSENSEIRTVLAIRHTFQKILQAYGQVTSTKKMNIVSYASGRISSIKVRVGEPVKKGQRLLTLKGLFAARGMEESGFKRKTGQGTNEDITLIAPENGTVAEINAQAGNMVNDGETILTLIAPDRLNVDLVILADNDIKVGQTAIINPGQNRQLTADISYIAPEIDPKSGGRHAGITLSGTNRSLLIPGEIVKVAIIVQTRLNALAVPTVCLLMDNGQPVVMVKKGPEYEKRKVTTGLQDSDYVEILSGLSGQEKIAAIRAYGLLNRSISEKIKVLD